MKRPTPAEALRAFADFTAGLCLFVLITTSAHPEVMIGAAVAGWSLGRLR